MAIAKRENLLVIEDAAQGIGVVLISSELPEILGMTDRIRAHIPIDTMLPAVAQGAIGLEIRDQDERMKALLAPLNDVATARAVAAERAFLARLEGSCRTPIAGYATIDGDELYFRGQVLSPDGQQSLTASRRGNPHDAEKIGADTADEVLAAGAASLLGRNA